MIAQASYTIVDLADPILQGSEPTNPVDNMLWLDTSVSPNQLKRYESGTWKIVNDTGDIRTNVANILSELTTVEQKITDSSIISTVTNSQTWRDLNGEVQDTKTDLTQVTQTANKINWLVQSGSSQSNIVLTDKALQAIADDIDLSANDTINITAPKVQAIINEIDLSNNDTVQVSAQKIQAVMNEIDLSVNSQFVVTSKAAQTAVDTASQLESEMRSKGTQLVTNGNGSLRNNTNFLGLSFDSSVSNDSFGSFTETKKDTIITDDYIILAENEKYKFEFDAKSRNGLATLYSMLVFYDVDGNCILPFNNMFVPNTLTYLTQKIENGDTVIHLNNIANWDKNTSTAFYKRGFIFWNYANSKGYVYPENTYSRNVFTDMYSDSGVNKTNNTITLKKPWSFGTVASGTKLSQSDDDISFKIIGAVGDPVPNSWFHYSANIQSSVDTSGRNEKGLFPPATAYVRIGFVWNNNEANDQIWITNVSLKQNYSDDIELIRQTADNAYSKSEDNQSSISRLTSSVQGLSTSLGVYQDGVQIKINQFEDTLSAVTYDQKGLRIQMTGSNYYTLTDSEGYHIYQNNKKIASFAKGHGKMDRLWIGDIMVRKTSKGGWVWTDAPTE